jgi:hypothetical protein
MIALTPLAAAAADSVEPGAQLRTPASTVLPVPPGMSTPSLNVPGTNLTGGGPAVLSAPAPSVNAPMPASALVTIDPKSLPQAGRDYTPTDWGKLVAATPGEGAKAILKSMNDTPVSDPQLRVTLADGEKLDGRFRGLNGGRMVFESEGKLLGLDLKNMDVTRVSRLVDVLFDGSQVRPAEVVVHDRPAVADPFKDLGAYKGRVVEMDIRDLDDMKWSRQTVSGRIVKADGKTVELKSAKGTTTVSREYHQIDSVSLRTEPYSSHGKITTIADVNDEVPIGTAVVLTFPDRKTVSGLFRGVRKEARGLYAVIETPDGKFRGYRDFYDLRTQGEAAAGLLPGSETLYAHPEQ